MPVLLLAAFLALALGNGAAWPAVGGGHGGSHFGSPGRGHPGGSFPRGREFGSGREILIFPYFYDPYYPNYPYDPYCDPYSPSYAPQYCY